MVALIVVIVVVIVVVAGYTLLVGIHRSSSSSGQEIVLVPYGTSYSFPLGQFAGIAFHVNLTSTIQGKINSSEGAVLDLMTPAEFNHLAVTLNVSGYEWTSGAVADQTIYDAVISVPPGQWYLAFLDANPSFPTGITFYSNLTLTTG